MTEPTSFASIRTAGGGLAGPVRHPHNLEQAVAGSIHEDSTAQRLGLRGGTVAGSLHMEQFPPLLTQALGDAWWREGGLSLYFRFATTDGEAVQCFCRPGDTPVEPGEQIAVWMTMEDERLVAEGSAWVGSASGKTPLARRIENVPRAEDLRIFAELGTGRELEGLSVRVPLEELDRRLSVIVEPLDLYGSPERYGGRVLPPSLMVRAMAHYTEPLLDGWPDRGVGLYGAIEIEHLSGPCFVEHDYQVRGRVLAVGETPKTEYFWYESTLSEPAGGEDRARMLMMLRFMKASSPLWQ